MEALGPPKVVKNRAEVTKTMRRLNKPGNILYRIKQALAESSEYGTVTAESVPLGKLYATVQKIAVGEISRLKHCGGTITTAAYIDEDGNVFARIANRPLNVVWDVILKNGSVEVLFNFQPIGCLN